MRIEPDNNASTKRLESERETLPFPAGGVFAGQNNPAADEGENEMITSTDDVIASIDRLFDVMQDQMDTISEEVDHTLRIREQDEDFDPYPAA